jgi:hypothetical protein
VYRLLANPGKEYVLKVDAGRPREARFYRDLSPRVPVRVPRLVASAELDGSHGRFVWIDWQASIASRGGASGRSRTTRRCTGLQSRLS